MIVFNCKQCGNKLKVKEAFAGRRGKCPFCGTIVKIPFPSKPASDSEVGSATEMITASILEEARADTTPVPPTRIRFQCPNCAELVSATSAYIGKQVVCPHCRKSITVPSRAY